ncbi:MAG: CGNR zinc finger domain-containing protein [Myxococcota bacterium]
MDPGDLPLLGEALAVELTNTQYGEGETAFDFLGEPAWADVWLRAMDRPAVGYDELLALRDATHAAVGALIAGVEPRKEVVRTLSALAQRGAPQRHFRWRDDGPCIATTRRGPMSDRRLGALATEVVEWLCTDETGALRRCDALDCTMVFVKQHHRRRWCHPSCGHRMRQAAYYRRQRSGS